MRGRLCFPGLIKQRGQDLWDPLVNTDGNNAFTVVMWLLTLNSKKAYKI